MTITLIGAAIAIVGAIADDTSKPTTMSLPMLLIETGMDLEMPHDFAGGLTHSSHGLLYDRAIISENGKVELRVAVRPIARMNIDYDDPHGAIPHPNGLSELLMDAYLDRVAVSRKVRHELATTTACEEYGADKVWIQRFVARGSFSPRRPNGILLTLHRDDRADAFMSVLWSSDEDAVALIKQSVHALRFDDTPDPKSCLAHPPSED